jgi:hypothetical protein
MTTNHIYPQAKIYQIRSQLSDKIYIGSTCGQTLNSRFNQHKNEYKRFLLDDTQKTTTSAIIFGFGDAYIELIELFPCNNKTDLRLREGYYIRLLNCVNKRIEGRTDQEYYNENKELYKAYSKKHYKENIEYHKAYNKKYNKENIELHKAYRKKKYNDNKELYKIKNKKYCNDNKKKIKKQKKIYYNANKDKTLKKILCNYCGSNFTYRNKAQHIKTNKHIKIFKLAFFECWNIPFTGILDSEDY